MQRKILLAKSAGFCYGVRRAVSMVAEAVLGKESVATLGPIIHNTHVVDGFRQRGVCVLENADQADAGQVVVIRSHGVPCMQVEKLLARSVKIVDATCPYVRRIHDIVAKAGQKTVVVVGDYEHPEVQAILSYTKGEIFVIANAAETARLPLIPEAIVIAQTTARRKVWEEILDALSGKIGDLDIYDTICAATSTRQAEAEDIARQVEAMLIVGSRHSANTRQLVQLCVQYTKVYAVESVRDIPEKKLRSAWSVGITAGASAPDEIIKEVVTFMSELDSRTPEIQGVDDATQTQEPVSDESSSFMTEFEKTLVSIKPGQVVVGTIVQITEDEVCVNIGYKSDGIIPKAELTSDGDPRDQFKIGDEIEVEVVKVNDGEGNVLLSQRNIMIMKNWDGLVENFENGDCVEGVGKDVVKGGLICQVMGIRTFVPASQLAERYVEKIDQFIGKTLTLKIIEVDRAKRRLVASRKVALLEESKRIKDELWEKLVPGKTIHGTVRRLTDFGAFVDIGGMDGLIHVTDLSWGRVRHPSDAVKPNDEVDVQVLAVDRDRERISLGLKQLQPKPWDNAPINYPADSVVEGKVVRMVTFGAFVELEPGLDGLVHISEISPTRIERVEDALQIGQIVRVKVLDVNSDGKRISLSIRRALDEIEPHDALDALPSDLSEAVLAASSLPMALNVDHVDSESDSVEEVVPDASSDSNEETLTITDTEKNGGNETPPQE